jgi:hypothetical protein
VQPYSNLVFHNTRIIRSGEHALTAIDATTTARRLEYFDEHLVAMLVNHLQHAHGGFQSFAKAGLQRCLTLQRDASTVVSELGSDASVSADLCRVVRGKRNRNGWFAPTQAAYERVIKSNSVPAFSGLLATFFAMDERMPVEMAWALQLIDKVEGGSVLKPDIAVLPSASQVASNSPFRERLAA